MTDDSNSARANSPMSTAEVYAMALRRLGQGKQQRPSPPPLQAHNTDREPDPAGIATGWRKMILPWHEPLTIEDLRDDLCTGLIAAGSPRGAAVYTGEETDMGAEVIFSPAAAAIFGAMKIMRSSVDCDQPADGDAVLLCGDEG